MCDKCKKKLAIRKANYEKCNIYPVSIHSWGQKLLLCKHDECEHKKRLNFYTQYKISTAFCDFIPKCRRWRIVDTVKDKKKKKQIYQNKNNKRKQKTTTKNSIAKLGFEPRALAWKAKIIATGVLYHMAN